MLTFNTYVANTEVIVVYTNEKDGVEIHDIFTTDGRHLTKTYELVNDLIELIKKRGT